MSLEIQEKPDQHLVAVNITGTLTRQDYAQFLPRIEEVLARSGPVRMLVDLHDFHGWTMGAAWDDLKFGLKHAHNIDRLAIIGEKRWQRFMSNLAGSIMHAPVNYYDHTQIQNASEWLNT